MRCNQCEARLAPFVDGDLTPRDRVAVLRHVKTCPHCAALLAELRVIDGLLLGPGNVWLADDFTAATMAELRELPRPAKRRTPLAALVVCYLVGSWLLLLAASVLAPQMLRALALTALDNIRTFGDALGGLGHVFARLAGVSLIVNAAVAMTAFAVLRRARLTIAERLRW